MNVYKPVIVMAASVMLALGSAAKADSIDFRQFSGNYSGLISGSTVGGVGFKIGGPKEFMTNYQGWGWAGDFPNEYTLLQGIGQGPTTIWFDSPIDSFDNLGYQVSFYGEYNATLTAYGMDGKTVLGSSTYTTESGNEMGTQLGFNLSIAGIRSLVISSTSDTNSFALGNVGPVNLVAAAPEPATWGMMILGFAIVGAALRIDRRKSRRLALV